MLEETKFDSEYYNEDYFKTPEWLGCEPIVKTWKEIFNLNDKSCVLDVGCGRGTFIGYLRNIGIETHGFDFSEWAINNPYPKCHKDWIRCHDATKQFPYGGSPFDLVLCLDLMEHMYIDDIDKVINEIFRVGNKWIFLQIATVDSNSNGYILEKEDLVPKELEGMAVAGHVTVQNKQFWINKLMANKENKWKLRDDKVKEFIKKVPSNIISNWTKNTILILEKV